MPMYHAVMIDETGCEFGTTISANSRHAAFEILDTEYPESRCVQLENKHESQERERRMYRRIERAYEYGYESDNEDY